MSAYKKLNKQDAFITTYTAHKSWALSGSQFDSYGIQAFNSARRYNPNLFTTGPLPASQNTSYTANSLGQLYYPTRSAATGEIISHSYDYYYQTSLLISGSRTYDKNRSSNLGDIQPYLFSIPRNLYGVNIRPGSFRIKVDNPQFAAAIVNGYVGSGYVTNGGIPTLGSATDVIFLDDAEGNIYVSGSNPRYIVGDIIYPHGMVVVTDDLYSRFFQTIQTPFLVFGSYRAPSSWTSTTMSFDSSHPIFTHNYHCKVRESEYNFTYNPTALSSSIRTTYDSIGNIYNPSGSVNNGILKNNVTGSSFQPYITTVGLYNDANQLIAVGKMTTPIPKSANTEMTIIVKIDI